MKLTAPFVRLPYTFNTDKLHQEVQQISQSEWQPHPGKHKGNYAIPLITVDGGMNDMFAGQMLPTKYLKNMPYTRQVIASFGEVVSRSRIMIIEGKQTLPLHTDINYHWYNRVRIHIPIVTNPQVEFTCDGHKANMPAGEAWLLDTWHSHQVINNSDETRIHLVFDTAGSAKFWDLVERSDNPTLENGNIGPDPKFINYEPNKGVQIITEQFNVPLVMSPGEIDGLTADILNDLHQHSGNSPYYVSQFNKIVDRFRCEWRQIYAVNGMQPTGWQSYQGLVEQTVQSVQSINAQLLLNSNKANAVNTLCARVLWPSFNQQMAKYYS